MKFYFWSITLHLVKRCHSQWSNTAQLQGCHVASLLPIRIIFQDDPEPMEELTLSIALKHIQDNEQKMSQLKNEVQEMKQTLEKVLKHLERASN